MKLTVDHLAHGNNLQTICQRLPASSTNNNKALARPSDQDVLQLKIQQERPQMSSLGERQNLRPGRASNVVTVVVQQVPVTLLVPVHVQHAQHSGRRHRPSASAGSVSPPSPWEAVSAASSPRAGPAVPPADQSAPHLLSWSSRRRPKPPRNEPAKRVTKRCGPTWGLS